MRKINHPAKGSSIKVDPIKNLADIKKIKNLLHNNPRNYCIFLMGINTNLRASDLCNITYDMVSNINKPMDEIVLREQKTGKSRRISVNNNLYFAIKKLVDNNHYQPGDQLFKGRKGAIRPETIHHLVKSWCRKVGIKGNFGSHSLRKTWGYHQRVTFGVDIPVLMVCFNHSTQEQTLDYLCIQPEEIVDVYKNEL